ncbi:DUF305 domain-containing protein [Amycolatopsis pigmentata]|uniref:DUF305 domain-containing protein n=1 Tax=Amycolatopsis pigmentata TaxID=450801 RepID=A0ABW5G3W0_9PSEU
MNKTAAGLAAAITTSALILGGCSGGAQSSGDMGGMTMSGTTADASATAHDTTDVVFTQQMIAHHQQGQDMVALASSHASDPRVKALASKIDQAQGAQVTAMRGWLVKWGVTTPSGTMTAMPGMEGMPGMGSMNLMSDSDMRQLRQAQGAAFDKLFVRMMTAHHESGVGMARGEVAAGTSAQAKALAQNIITDETAEIDEMRQVQTAP